MLKAFTHPLLSTVCQSPSCPTLVSISFVFGPTGFYHGHLQEHGGWICSLEFGGLTSCYTNKDDDTPSLPHLSTASGAPGRERTSLASSLLFQAKSCADSQSFCETTIAMVQTYPESMALFPIIWCLRVFLSSYVSWALGL